MLRIKDEVDLEGKLHKELSFEWDGFNECYTKQIEKEGMHIEISIFIWNKSIVTLYYNRYDCEEIEYSEEDTTLEELKEYAPELLELVEKVGD